MHDSALEDEVLDEEEEFGELLDLVDELFSEIDVNKDGVLQWNNGEIRRFAQTLAERMEWTIPRNWGDGEWYRMYRQFDKDGSYSLTADECDEFAKHLFEVTGARKRHHHKLQVERLSNSIVRLQSDIVICQRMAGHCIRSARDIVFRPLQIYWERELLATVLGMWHALRKHSEDIMHLLAEQRRIQIRKDQAAHGLSLLMLSTTISLNLQWTLDVWRCLIIDLRASKYVQLIEAESHRAQSYMAIQNSLADAQWQSERAFATQQFAYETFCRKSALETAKSLLIAWRDICLIDSIVNFMEREKRMRDHMKAVAEQKKLQVLQDWCDADRALAMQSALVAWKTVLIQGRSWLAEVARLNGAQGVLRWHMEAQRESLLRKAFNSWYKSAGHESLGRQLARLQAMNVWLLGKCGDKAKWMMEACRSGHQSMVMKDILVAWKKLACDARHRSTRNQISREKQKLENKSMDHVALALRAIFLELSAGLCRVSFAGWRDVLPCLKAEKEHQELFNQMNAQQAKAELYKERALLAMMNSGEALSTHLVFAEWSGAVQRNRHEKCLQGFLKKNNELEEVRAQALVRAASHMLDWHHGSLTREAMDAWIVLYTDAMRALKKERAIDEAQAKQAQKDLVMARTGHLLAEHNFQLLMKHVFAAWHEYTVESRRERHEQYHLERKLRWRQRGAEAMGTAISGWCAAKDKNLRDYTLRAWLKLFASERVLREQQSLNTEILCMRLDEEEPSNRYIRLSLILWCVGSRAYLWCLLAAWVSVTADFMMDIEIEQLTWERNTYPGRWAGRDILTFMLKSETRDFMEIYFREWIIYVKEKPPKWTHKNGWVQNTEPVVIDFGEPLSFGSLFST